MAGKVRTEEKCSVCRGKFQLAIVGQSPDLICHTCRTRPKAYFIDARSLDAGRIFRDSKTGNLFRSYEAAYQQLEEMRRRVKNHTFDAHDYIKKDLDTLKFKTKAEMWLGRIKLDKSYSYIRHSRTEMETHILPIFGETDVRDIRTHHITDFYYHLVEKSLSPKSIKNILATLKTFLRSLDDIIERFPSFPIVKVPQAPAGWLNRERQTEVLEAIPDRHRLIFDALVETACRPGEVCALKKKDLIDGEICIERAFDEKDIKSRKGGKVLYRGVSLQLWQALLGMTRITVARGMVIP